MSDGRTAPYPVRGVLIGDRRRVEQVPHVRHQVTIDDPGRLRCDRAGSSNAAARSRRPSGCPARQRLAVSAPVMRRSLMVRRRLDRDIGDGVGHRRWRLRRGCASPGRPSPSDRQFVVEREPVDAPTPDPPLAGTPRCRHRGTGRSPVSGPPPARGCCPAHPGRRASRRSPTGPGRCPGTRRSAPPRTGCAAHRRLADRGRVHERIAELDQHVVVAHRSGAPAVGRRDWHADASDQSPAGGAARPSPPGAAAVGSRTMSGRRRTVRSPGPARTRSAAGRAGHGWPTRSPGRRHRHGGPAWRRRSVRRASGSMAAERPSVLRTWAAKLWIVEMAAASKSVTARSSADAKRSSRSPWPDGPTARPSRSRGRRRPAPRRT